MILVLDFQTAMKMANEARQRQETIGVSQHQQGDGGKQKRRGSEGKFQRQNVKSKFKIQKIILALLCLQ